MIISVASGKGGTGKTLVSTSLALSVGKVHFLDCDVEEPNAYIFLKPKISRTEKVTIKIPQVDEKKCSFCGKCAEVCEYNCIVVAKEKVLIFDNLCHSCGACKLFCPEGVIFEKEKEIGKISFGRLNDIEIASGELNVGEAIAVPVIKKVKKQVKKDETVIIDTPPGTSCPVIEAVKDSDYSILVTEPTPFGLADLKLAVEVIRKLKIPFGLIINKHNSEFMETDRFCKEKNIPILLRIPEDRKIAEAYSKGIPLTESFPEYKNKLKIIFDEIIRVKNVSWPINKDYL